MNKQGRVGVLSSEAFFYIHLPVLADLAWPQHFEVISFPGSKGHRLR